MDFAPYQEVADRIDTCLGVIGYHKAVGDLKAAYQEEVRLKNLREEIKALKKRRKSFIRF